MIHSHHAGRLLRIASGPGKGNHMQDKKQKRAKIQVIFLILISTLVLLADFYAIINYPKEYMLIAAITVIFVVCLWGVISGFFSLNALKEDRREEQYDSIFKSEKASYLMLRKYFDEIEEKIEILQKESRIPTEDIINAQKAIAKVVITRNKENADAIMSSNEQLMETFEQFENRLKESNDFIIESQKNVIYENLKDIMEKQQALSDSIKDMEIRLSQAITANPIQFTANVEVPKQPTDASQAAPVMEPIPEPVMEMIPEPVVEEAATAEPEPVPVAVIEPEPVTEALHVPEPEPVTETPEPVVEPSPAAEEAVADTTNSDPNRQLSADEIAALFASANGGTDEAESEPPAEEAVADTTNSDPNRQLSADEIAALFASANGGTGEAESEPPAEEVVADTTNSDPNRQLSADEIAALFASANGGTGEAKSEPPAEAVTEPVPEVKEEPAKPQVVDLNNTNRNLTPDEIAALFSSM